MHKPFPYPIRGFQGMQISSTAFESIELLHVSKAVELLGATYTETLVNTASCLVCNTTNASRGKIKHALKWEIPAVRAEWLWDCIKQGGKLPFDQYLLCPHRQAHVCAARSLKPEPRSDDSAVSHKPRDRSSGSDRQPESDARSATDAQPRKLKSSQENSTSRPAEAHDTGDSELLFHDARSQRSLLLSNGLPRPSAATRPNGPSPLRERSPNISPKPSPPKPAPSSPQTSKGPDPLNDAISSLLAHHRSHRSNSTASSATGSARTASAANLDDVASALPNPTRRKRKLLGRATSNVSAASAGERSRPHSPAKSLDSLHTDGLGTPIEAPAAPSRPGTARDANDKASAAAPAGQREPPPPPLLLSDDRELDADGDAVARAGPVLTQVGYEDRDAQLWRASLMRKVGGRASGASPGGEEAEGQEETGEEYAGSVAENRARMMREGSGEGGIAKRTRRAGRA